MYPHPDSIPVEIERQSVQEEKKGRVFTKRTQTTKMNIKTHITSTRYCLEEEGLCHEKQYKEGCFYNPRLKLETNQQVILLRLSFIYRSSAF